MKRLTPSLFLLILVLIAAACGGGDVAEDGDVAAPVGSPVPVEPTEAVAEEPEPEPPQPSAAINPSPTSLPSSESAAATSTAEPEKPQLYGRIAFVSNQNGPDSIFVMDVNDPSGARQLTQASSSGSDWWPTWCGEEEILFERTEDPEFKEVISINLNDGNMESITSSILPDGSVLNGAPVCSRDGNLVALSSRVKSPDSENLGWHTGIIDRADGSFSAIGDYVYNARHVSWSPDGDDIVFMHLPLQDKPGVFQIFRVHLDDPEAYLNLTENSDFSGKYPKWSPVSDEIAFACSEGEDEERIWSLCLSEADQDGISVMLSEIGFGPEQGARADDRIGYFITPSWSPDGSHLTFASNMDGNWEIYTVELATGKLVNLTNTPDVDEMQPRWEP